jgi:predicted ATP-grasp superfamily ATP-dependent carboligase
VAPPGDPVFYSRFTRQELSWEDTEANAESSVDALMRFGAAQLEPPVLFYQADSQLLLVSRHREQLAQVFRFVIAEPDLVEVLTDKARFQALANHLDLPVPAARRVNPSGDDPAEIDLRFPVVIKPVRHSGPWQPIAGLRKALSVETAEALRELWPHLAAVNLDLLIQEAIPGPESRIESYHVYVDQVGVIVAEFTGRKIRTHPVSYGQSTALETTDADDVKALGREIVEKLGLRGVAKLDFKRGPDGFLHLLEVNPRFTLWHHLGAVAGVNVPALVYADLVGLPRPTGLSARVGVRWCKLWTDVHAARASGIPFPTWLLWALRCEAKSTIAWDDPMPLLRGTLARMPLLRGY